MSTSFPTDRCICFRHHLATNKQLISQLYRQTHTSSIHTDTTEY